MINSQNLIDKICACITGGGLTTLQTCQLNGALQVLCAPVCSVPAFSNLPSATDHVGRMIYVHAENRYYHAVAGCWFNDFQSTPYVYENDVWSWGSNTSGRLGDNTITNRSSPVSVVGGFTDWCQASAGGSNSLAVRTSGSAWSWGSNSVGQLGDGTITDSSSPVSVVGGFTDWYQASAGSSHSLAVRSSGSAWAWGYGSIGKLGNNATTNRSSPVSVVGGITDWQSVSAGFSHSLVVRSSGTAWAWGYNGGGRLGNNTTTDRSSPVSVVGGFTDWCQVSAGNNHSLAVRSSGSAWSWGCNANGQLGDQTTTNSSSPVSVAGGFSDWCDINSGSSTSLAIRTNGTAWAWGSNSAGKLGDNTTSSSSSPVSVVGGFSDWCAVSAGSSHSLGIRLVSKGF